MSETKKGLFYRFGRLVGAWPKASGGLLVAGSCLLIGNSVINNRQIEAENQKLAQAAADSKARSDQARGQACGANFEVLQSQATALLKAGNANQAFNLVAPCILYPAISASARAFIQSTSTAATQETAAANRIAKAKQDAEAKKVALADKAARRKEGVSIGMSRQEALDSNWGKPRKVNRTTGAAYEHEQWVYDGGYLYFESGKLTAIQN